MAMVDPPHPGGIVKRECLEALGLSVTKAAEGLGVSRQALSELVNEKVRGVGGDGDSVVEGFWVESRDLVGDADGL